MAKRKFYVVWQGKVPGVYDDWKKAEAQIKNFPQAKYKSFENAAAAEAAYKLPWEHYYKEPGSSAPRARKIPVNPYSSEIIVDSVSVDAACSGNPGVMEYRGVDTTTGYQLFNSEKYPVGTNNIGEFLAIVHALALFAEKKPGLTIYSDSVNAMNWVKKGKCRTKLPVNARTEKLHQVVERAEKWLATHTWSNPLKKWETQKWGEIPADFGRK